NLILEIARKYGIKCYDVLTGFKYIGELMTLKRGKEEFVIGGEESYGFLVGDLVRDKDAVVSCAFIAEMTAYFKDQGKTLYETLLDIYAQYGYFQEKQVSITKTGKSGAEEIVAMMNQFRATPPRYLGGIEVIEIRDYKQSVALTVNTKREEPIELPKSDVLQFITSEGDVISIRPSGTEPKIKFYCNVRLATKANADFSTMEAA